MHGLAFDEPLCCSNRMAGELLQHTVDDGAEPPWLFGIEGDHVRELILSNAQVICVIAGLARARQPEPSVARNA
jgi:hypothetical protein